MGAEMEKEDIQQENKRKGSRGRGKGKGKGRKGYNNNYYYYYYGTLQLWNAKCDKNREGEIANIILLTGYLLHCEWVYLWFPH